MALRSDKFFARMMFTYDIRQITRNPHAEPSTEQLELIEEANQQVDESSNENAEEQRSPKWKHNLIGISGEAGTGKTLVAAEILKHL